MKPLARVRVVCLFLQEFSRHGNKNNNETEDLARRQEDQYFKRKEQAVTLTAPGGWREAGGSKSTPHCGGELGTGGNCRNVPLGNRKALCRKKLTFQHNPTSSSSRSSTG